MTLPAGQKSTRRPRNLRALIIACALVASACDSGAADTTTTAAPTTTTTTAPTTTTTTEPPLRRHYGGTVVYAQLRAQEPTTLNPLVQGGNTFAVSVIGNAYLVGVQKVDGETLELVPDAVVELPTVGNGGLRVNLDGTMTVRYLIRDEAVWADGVPISGEDFLFTYETIMDPALGINRAHYEDIMEDTIVVGPKRFEFTMLGPTTQVEYLFQTILPKHDVEGSDFLADWNDRMWVSGGPFVFERWQQGSHITVSRNENYWRHDPETEQQLPYLDEVVFRFVPTLDDLIAAFEEGEADMVTPRPRTEAATVVQMVERFSALEPAGAVIDVVPGEYWEHLTFSFSENSLVRNPNSYNAHLEYRRAVAHAIDKDLLTESILGGIAGPLTSYVSAYAPALSSGAWAAYEYDPELAREYLETLCAKEGIDCEAHPPTAVFTSSQAREPLADLLGDMLQAVGIEYRIELEHSGLFFGDTLDSGTWDLGAWGWGGVPGVSSLIALHVHAFNPDRPPPAGSNTYRWGSPAVEGADYALFDQAESIVVDEHTVRAVELADLMAHTVDLDEIAAYVAEFEGLLADQVVFIPLYPLEPGVAAIWASRVGGVKNNTSMSTLTWNMAAWYLADE
jgi:peptide/nickel transport system substrate-binding protein